MAVQGLTLIFLTFEFNLTVPLVMWFELLHLDCGLLICGANHA